MKYLVQWNYKSSLGGPWVAGQMVDVSLQVAEAVNRDSPGVLVQEGQVTAREYSGDLPVQMRIELGKSDRMVKAPGRSRAKGRGK